MSGRLSLMVGLIATGMLIAACAKNAAPDIKEGKDTMAVLNVGDLAPDFTLPSDDGRDVSLSSFRDSQVVVLYFYPRDQTPGCTKQACGFRDHAAAYAAKNAVVLGVSVDPIESHQAFRKAENLNFTLLSDVSKSVVEKYGVLEPRGNAERVTFLIGRDGRIRRIFKDFDAASNASEVLAALEP